MPSRDVRERDLKASIALRCDGAKTNMFYENGVRASTMRDVARVAGVSTATVSRVISGGESVSGKTRTEVLKAISSLQYCPNAHAAELGRAKGGIRKNRSGQIAASARSNGRMNPDSGTGARKPSLCKVRRLHMLGDKYSQMKRLISHLSMDLKKLRAIAEECKQCLDMTSANAPH
jgi:hypothetical protein